MGRARRAPNVQVDMDGRRTAGDGDASLLATMSGLRPSALHGLATSDAGCQFGVRNIAALDVAATIASSGDIPAPTNSSSSSVKSWP